MSVNLKSISGPSAGSVKYDVLTMLSLAGMRGSTTLQVSMLRLVALITARYNWRNDELVVGQRDMARMWGVTERTVKREIKRLTETQILVCKRPGVRGRVGAYRLNQAEIAGITRDAWPQVGPDFAYRMAERYKPAASKVVPLRHASPLEVPDDDHWGPVSKSLATHHPDAYSAWLGSLRFDGLKEGRVHLSAENRFKKHYVETHFSDILLAAIEEQFGLGTRFVVSGAR